MAIYTNSRYIKKLKNITYEAEFAPYAFNFFEGATPIVQNTDNERQSGIFWFSESTPTEKRWSYYFSAALLSYRVKGGTNLLPLANYMLDTYEEGVSRLFATLSNGVTIRIWSNTSDRRPGNRAPAITFQFYKPDGTAFFYMYISWTVYSASQNKPGYLALAVDDVNRRVGYFSGSYRQDPTKSMNFTIGYNVTDSSETYDYIIDCLTFFDDDPNDDENIGQGGEGVDDGSTPIPFPSLPTLSAVETGFVTLFAPNLGDIQQLASYMWNSDFIESIKRLRADPIDNVLALSIIPVTPVTSGRQILKVGNVETTVSMPIVTSQYVTVNCGSISIHGRTGSYLDYAPYTKCSIFIPFSGVHPLDVDEIMDKILTLRYNIDVLTGAGVALLMCGESVLYTFTCNIAMQIPITSGNFGQMYLSQIQLVGSSIGTVAAVAAGPVTGAIAAGTMASRLSNTVAAVGTSIQSGAGAMASAIMNGKPQIEHSGNMGGGAGALGNLTPYLIFKKPRLCVPQNQNSYMGYPTYDTYKLGDIAGFTIVDSIKLESRATDEEKSIIIQLLQEGVIL